MYEDEIWRAVKGYEGLYEVSNLGRVRSLDRISKGRRRKGRILRHYVTGSEYFQVCLSKEGESKNIAVHRLVATAFVPNPEKKETVNHINEDKRDNRSCNLQWLTLEENLHFGTRAERQRKTLTKNIGVPVFQILPDRHNVVARYESLTLAGEAVGAQPNEIWEAARDGIRCRDFFWRRADSINEQDLLFWRDTGEQILPP